MEDPRPEPSHFSELSTYKAVEARVDNQLAESVDKGRLTSRKDNEQEMMRIPYNYMITLCYNSFIEIVA